MNTQRTGSKRAPATFVLVTTLVTISGLLAGCGSAGFSGLYNAPLPGGADLGDHPYEVHAQFADVLDLVPQAAVQVHDVPVGKIERIGLSPDNTTAEVTMMVNGDVRLPANADARLRQSSLLGEKFVELAPPAGEPPAGRLTSGAVIPMTRTNRNPQIEEVLGALSMLLNGGGVAQLQVIVREMNNAMSGNENQIRDMLSNLDNLARQLDAQRDNITRAIDGLNRLSGTLRAQTGHIQTALNDLGPGIQVIDSQRDQLVTMLQSMNRLSTVSVQTINRSKDNMVADLRALAPTVQKLADTGTTLPQAIGYLASYPFPEYAMHALKGDYVNVDVQFDFDLDSLVGNLLRSSGPPVPVAGVSDSGQSTLPLTPIPYPPPGPPPGPRTPPPTQGQSGGLLNNLLGGG